MEQMLIKMAAQLIEMDEASLDSLWEKYAEIVNAFEPSKRWEQAVLILSFIQSVRWKNQLFNSQWAMRNRQSLSVDMNMPGASEEFTGMLEDFAPQNNDEQETPHQADIIPFKPLASEKK